MKKRRNKRNQHFALVVGIILISFFNKSIRDIPKYYKSLLYVSSFNLIYYYLCKRHLVWEFIPTGVNWLIIRIAHVIIVTPLLVVIFLSKMPVTFFKKCIHLLRSVFIATVVEFFAHKKQLILYAHGWNIYWSSLLYGKMFMYSYLFTRKPLTTLFLSLCSTVFLIFKFKVPLKRKHISEYFKPFTDLYYHTFIEDLFSRKRRKIL
ncbi:hypothetical protein [Sutcliffiella sp. NC1]|uniref:Uncharacterized protein n=1 Tax=Sutcliffiella cohnii TaxID=33932 RepID=A0A223KNM4_9BACI|nr:hypothetical protein [Sutcliffiella sp. NC1]AST90997.1 hypothetical protein BC6307_06740 [Sutcliffiella cohnii]WBL16790.1 hypothetical protein O1A01_09205 [Sutcliffiella sp. NC1]